MTSAGKHGAKLICFAIAHPRTITSVRPGKEVTFYVPMDYMPQVGPALGGHSSGSPAIITLETKMFNLQPAADWACASGRTGNDDQLGNGRSRSPAQTASSSSLASGLLASQASMH